MTHCKAILLLLGIFYISLAHSLTFTLPANSDIIGTVQTAYVQHKESFADIGRRFDLGIYEMIEANPNLDPWIPTTGAAIVIPTQYILPPGPRQGMVINLAEMRLSLIHI